ncbi:MAG: phage tail tube protein [Lachnospiraceae bacterium]
MLANGIKLGYKKTAEGTSYEFLAGLKEVPELGADPEKVDNTTLDDTIKQYEFGIGDAGDMAYKFKYSNDKATDAYRILRELEAAGKAVPFEQLMPDGTKFHFNALLSIKTGGGAVNAAIEFTLNLGLQSDISIVDPTTV